MFLLPDPVPCSGRVQSWQGYGFFAPEALEGNLTTRIFAAVFRRIESVYTLVGVQRIEIPLPPFEVNGTAFNETAAGSTGVISVECGDRIVAGFDSACSSTNPRTCPLIAAVTTSNETINAAVDYTPFVVSDRFEVDSFTSRRDVRILLQATIVQQGTVV